MSEFSGKRLTIVVYYTHVNGVKSFVWHLCRGLELCGVRYDLLKLHSRTEHGISRRYAPGVHYRNVSETQILATKGPMLIATTDPKRLDLTEELTRRGARVVIHSNIPGDTGCQRNAIVIHRSLRKVVPSAVFLPHPYVRTWSRTWSTQSVRERKHAVSITRLDPKKGTDMVLRAMQAGAAIDLYGDLMPFYGMHLDKKFPSWRKRWRGKFPLGEGANICADYRYMIDLTNRGDESGSQYTFFEAMDAGAVPVIHEAWAGEEMIPGENCIAVSDWRDLMHLPDLPYPRTSHLREMLNNHEAKKIARQWWRELTK